jgi:uncharacterized protein YcnI
VAGLALAATLGLALPASAHVTVGADDAHQGATDAVLTFRVPNEEVGATTVKVTVSFPKVTPLASVRPAAKPGWTFATTKVAFDPPITTDDGTISEGVGEVVWTAANAAAGIPAGGFETFQVLVGPLPQKASRLSFPTLQTYSDGKTVSWIQPITDPANEPDNPAPTLRLLPASDAATAPAVVAPQTEPSSGASAATADDVSGVRRLAVIALVVAVIAVLSGGAGVVLGRRRS